MPRSPRAAAPPRGGNDARAWIQQGACVPQVWAQHGSRGCPRRCGVVTEGVGIPVRAAVGASVPVGAAVGAGVPVCAGGASPVTVTVGAGGPADAAAAAAGTYAAVASVSTRKGVGEGVHCGVVGEGGLATEGVSDVVAVGVGTADGAGAPGGAPVGAGPADGAGDGATDVADDVGAGVPVGAGSADAAVVAGTVLSASVTSRSASRAGEAREGVCEGAHRWIWVCGCGRAGRGATSSLTVGGASAASASVTLGATLIISAASATGICGRARAVAEVAEVQEGGEEGGDCKKGGLAEGLMWAATMGSDGEGGKKKDRTKEGAVLWTPSSTARPRNERAPARRERVPSTPTARARGASEEDALYASRVRKQRSRVKRRDGGRRKRGVEAAAARGLPVLVRVSTARIRSRIAGCRRAQWPAPRRIASRRLYSYKLETFNGSRHFILKYRGPHCTLAETQAAVARLVEEVEDRAKGLQS
ncbi:hypothetical protein C8J57DRAFT_1461646 [Mycena rebaudengoi]|nr:hypothetical protein C8J57DRAFT_1461646 [Mycena rebaudengoi]